MAKTKQRKQVAAIPPKLIVGISAGAGSRPALLALLASMPVNSGAALFVFMDDDESERPADVETLGRHTPLNVQVPRPGMLIERDHVYVPPPKTVLGVAEGAVVKLPRNAAQPSLSSINRFLCALSDDLRHRAGVVVLSGKSSQVVLGTRAIKSQAGIVIVQEPRTAEFVTAPGSVINAGLSDHVVAPVDIPGILAAVAGNEVKRRERPGTSSHQQQRNLELRRVNKSLERKLSKQAELIEIVRDIAIASNEAVNVEDAFIYALRRICDYNGWLTGHAYRVWNSRANQIASLGISYINHEKVEDERYWERLQQFVRRAMHRRYKRGEGLVGRVLQTGQPCWIENMADAESWQNSAADEVGLTAAMAFPVRVNGDVAAVLECFSDQPMHREDRFMEIMENVGIQLGHVIERKQLEQDLTESVERAQRRIGSDIHDDVGQELTGLRLIAQAHLDALLSAGSTEESTARRICEGLQTVQKHMRDVVRQLMPVGLEDESFRSAIASLARRTAQLYGIRCRFDGDEFSVIRDQSAATHLYRIAQEAINNAIKHARCREITIRLGRDDKNIRLQILDDGQGIDARKGQGMGTRTMAYRAALIGGNLTIENRSDRSGTIVTCLVSIIHADAFEDQQ